MRNNNKNIKNNIPIKKRKRSPSPKEYRKKRTQQEVRWYGLEPPSEINTIQDLIMFSFTSTNPNIPTDNLRNIVGPLKELDEMIGLHVTKRTIIDMIMHYSQGYHNKNTDYLHMVVCGPPGCGKTNLCRILGKILSGLGILPKNTFTLVKRTDLIAKYLGQTAHRTEKLLEKCKGGVMFIDEAYSLAPRDAERDSFSKEAIDFLNQFLSEHKNDLLCIIAGYEEELEKTIFAMNDGLKRRFPWKFVIEPYSDEELLQIFHSMIKKENYTVEKDAINAHFFNINRDWFKFAGGDIETFITKCKMIHTRNTFGGVQNMKISVKDINDAIAEHKKHQNKKVDQPPLHMYI